MTQLDQLIRGLSEYGVYIKYILGEYERENIALGTTPENLGAWKDTFNAVALQNPWFTEEQVIYALNEWSDLLRESTLQNWLDPYGIAEVQRPKTIALILAGNIPLVGLHDLLCVLASGHKALIKLASNDMLLLPFIIGELQRFLPNLAERIRFTEGKLESFDAVIATGSNNTSRYFEYYFAKYPHIIRKNRNSIAILDGTETPEVLKGLAEDVFRYFGMGCRSVSKIFVPNGYNFDPLFQAFFDFKDLINHQKYANNYDYNKAVYLMSGSPMLDNAFLLLKEDTNLGSPIGTLFYEYYDDINNVVARLKHDKDLLQCTIGNSGIPNAIPFGSSQRPSLATYADNVDTMNFLITNVSGM
ncbi:MAG: hypothetical protein RLZZ241_330 [Bacteroidota bacterium]|jgi:hypothetical protein